MEENTGANIWLKLIYGGGRYVLGILIVVSAPLMLFLLGKDPTLMIHAVVNPFLTFFVTPQIIIGFYFMFTGKWRPRIDFTLLLIVALLVYVFFTFASGFGA